LSLFRLPATYADAAAFRDRLEEIDPALGCVDEATGAAGPMGQPLEHRGHNLANRWAIHPMEGWDGHTDGLPSEDTLRRWRNFGKSGAALIWGGEAFAVCPEGRANPNQLHRGSSDDVATGLRRLFEELRAGQAEAGLAHKQSLVGLQLTHSGRWSQPTPDGPAPLVLRRHPALDKRVGITDDTALLSDADLEALPAMYAECALMAQDAGFDFVDVKCCHGYLLHECLAARNRPGPYGGSFENRTRLFTDIVAAVRASCPGMEIGVRVSITDQIPGAEPADEEDSDEDGFGIASMDEPFAFLSLLQDMDIRLVNLTIGSPYYCPAVQRPAAFAPSDGTPPTSDPLLEVARHLRLMRQCKAAFENLVLVGTGYSYLQEHLARVAEYEVGAGHVDFVGLGRLVLAYPEYPIDHLAGRTPERKRICRTFSDCTTGPRNGMQSGCYPLDPVYNARAEARVIQAMRPTSNRKKGKPS